MFARGRYKAEYWVLRYSSFAYSLLFLPARRYASATNSDRNVSVRLSVCLSRAGIVSKRRKLASVMFFSPSGSPTILVFWRQMSSRHSKGFPRAGASNKGGVGKLAVTRPWPRLFWRKILRVMSVLLSLKTCMPNLKSVAPNHFGAIGI